MIRKDRTALPNPALAGTMLIPLSKGLFAIVDEADVRAVSQRSWYAVKARTTWYGQTGSNLTLHRFLWWIWRKRPTPEIDHENGNGLDCRRENLRAATRAQNAANSPKRRTNKSGYKGVSWDASRGLWRACIQVNGKVHRLGNFDDPAEAGEAYAAAAKALCGAFARSE